MGQGMDYIYLADNQEVMIEVLQEDTRREVAQRYIRTRKEKGITQTELARRAGIPRTNITRFESGFYNPSLEMMVRVAAALGMKLQVELVEEAPEHSEGRESEEASETGRGAEPDK